MQIEKQLAKTLDLWDVLILGLAGVVGTGVFVLTGYVAAHHTGPAVIFSFMLAAIAAALSGLCYAELAGRVTSSGSTYSYMAAYLGPQSAFFMGWILLLEYALAASMVAVGFSAYAVNLWQACFPQHVALLQEYLRLPFYQEAGLWHWRWGFGDLPALLTIVLVCWLLSFGLRLQAAFLRVLVILKLAMIFLCIVVLCPHIDRHLLWPLLPENRGNFGEMGFSGVLRGAQILFFAFCGFDSVCTAAQECKDPHRDIPRGIIGAIGLAALLYVVVALLLVGVVPYERLAIGNPMMYALQAIGQPLWANVLSMAALLSLFAVLWVQLYGQSRILLAMIEDGLLPSFLGKLHASSYAPRRILGLLAVAVGAVAWLCPLESIGELSSVGTLLAYSGVCLLVTMLRLRPQAFRLKSSSPLSENATVKPSFLIGGVALPIAAFAVTFCLFVSSNKTVLCRLIFWLALGGFYRLLWWYGSYRLRKKV